ncbi:MAG: arginase family protein [Butyrivibrio sp.]|nr:arginase family protein [Butyrivibrio sp.]
MNRNDVTIFDFSGIYESEDFYRKAENPRFISCKDITGTNCICDEYAQKALLQLMEEKNCPSEGIHFIDSGNYHYMSELLIRRLKEPVTLLLFDHHPDMQPSAFGDILSCGSWVKNALDAGGNIKQVIAIGVDNALAEEVSSLYYGSVHFYQFQDCMGEGGVLKLPQEPAFPIYLSVDKDVISETELCTNWDQGDMQSEALFLLLKHVLGQYRIAGADICGECAPDQDTGIAQDAISRSNRWNAQILSLLMK